MTALGLLVPGDPAEDDYPRIEQLLGSDVRVDLAPYERDRLPEILGGLRLAGAESVVWADTAASARPGRRAAHEHLRELARTAGLPASSTAFGFVHAAGELGVSRVAVTGEAGAFTDFLTESGVTVLAVTPDAGPLPKGAQALLLPDQAERTVPRITDLEHTLGVPVLTAHQVAVWEALRLTERRVNAPALGRLFTREPIVQV